MSIRIALRLMAALGAVAAPALAAQVVIVQSAHAQPSQQPALPPPPYAASAGAQPAAYGGPQAYDRYGGGTTHARVQPVNTATPAYSGPRLGWSGKTEVGASNYHPTPRYAGPSPSRGGRAATLSYSLPQRGEGGPEGTGWGATQPPAPQGWTYVPPIGARPVEPQPPAQAATIYDPPPPLAAPVRQVASAGPAPGAPRHYSMHREYGIEPDPIPPPGTGVAQAAADPLPAAFFAASPDLSQPETPEPSRKVPASGGKTRNAVQPEGGQ